MPLHTTYTSFTEVFNCFYSKITSDMFLEMEECDTNAMAGDLLVSAIPHFRFPRVPLEFSLKHHKATGPDGETYPVGAFRYKLTNEEINILATYMVVGWLGQQLANIELVRMKFSGSDFKLTSQANHLQKLLKLKQDYEREGNHLQSLYSRRKTNKTGLYISSLQDIMSPIGAEEQEYRQESSDWEEDQDDSLDQYQDILVWHDLEDE